MSKLNLTIEHKIMPTSATIHLIRKELEQIYYSILFSSSAYSRRADKWTQWLQMGFDVAIREQPRVADAGDKLSFNTASLSARTDFVITEGNESAVAQLGKVLSALGGVVKTKTDGRLEAAMALPEVKDKILKPMTDSMKKDNLRPDEVASFVNQLREAATILTESSVVSLKIGVPAKV